MELYSKETEVALLGAIKIDNDILNNIDIKREDFFYPVHKKVFNSMIGLYDKNIKIDDVSLYEDLKEEISINEIIKIDSPTAANFLYYAEIIKELSHKRKLNCLFTNAMKMLKTKDSKNIVEYLEQNTTGIYNEVKDFIDSKSACEMVLDNIETVRNGGRVNIQTGFDELDRLIDGLNPGEINIIAARASIGKSAIALCMARNMAYKGYKIGFFSLEMSTLSLMQRVVSLDSMVEQGYIKTGNIEMYSRKEKITEAIERLSGKDILIDDTSNIGLFELKNKIRQMKRNGIDVVFIDYLSLISYNVNKPTYERIGDIVKIIRGMAKELDIVIILLAQINRQGEGKMPNLSDLAQSGEIEQHADVIMFLHRKRGERDTRLKVAKNRNGPVGIINLIFLSDYVKFVDK